MSEELAEGESWTLICLPDEGKGERLLLTLHTAFGPIEIEVFHYSDSRSWAHWEIKRKYQQL
jgi:hypothetical protein